MLNKILFRNFLAHRNNYFVYIMATSSAVMVYFIFFLLNKNPAINNLDEWNNNFGLITQAFNTLLLVFEFIFVTYIGGTFIHEREKQFRLYRYLGISKYQIGMGIFLETLIIQMISWVIGLIMAIIFAKLFGMILLKVMGGNIEFRLDLDIYSISTIFKTMINFVFLTAIVNFIRIVRNKDKNKKEIKNKYIKYLLGVIGFFMIIYGYYLSIHFAFRNILVENSVKSMIYAIIIFIMVSIGTYWFYLGFIASLLRIMNASNLIKYNGKRKMTMFYFGKAVSRNVSSLWLITIVSGIAIVLLTAAAWIFQETRNTEAQNYPYDIAVSQRLYPQVTDILKRQKVKIKKINKIQVKKAVGSEDGYNYDPLSFISLSQYKKVMTKKGIKLNDKIKKNDILRIRENSNSLFIKKKIKAKYRLKTGEKFVINKQGSAFVMASTVFYGDVIVLPDQKFNELKSNKLENIYGINIEKNKNKSVLNAFKKLKKSKFYADDAYLNTYNQKSEFDAPWKKIYNDASNGINTYTKKNIEVKYYYSINGNRMRNYMLYMLIILSIVFIIALASILSIKQFSENTNNLKDYQVLKGIGVNASEVGRLVYYQTGLLFYSPMLLGGLHAIFALNFVFPMLDEQNLVLFFIILSGYLLIYTLLFIATAQISVNQIKNNIN